MRHRLDIIHACLHLFSMSYHPENMISPRFERRGYSVRLHRLMRRRASKYLQLLPLDECHYATAISRSHQCSGSIRGFCSILMAGDQHIRVLMDITTTVTATMRNVFNILYRQARDCHEAGSDN